MSSEKATALVLRAVDFSESSVVVTLFTREFGKVRALAKGGRRPKGPFESALDLLALCRIVFLRKSSEALDLLTEAKLERRFRPPSGALANLYAAYYVAELLSELTDDYDPHPELFDAAEQVLQALASPGAIAPAVVQFELAALRILGHLPSLDTCVECGKNVNESGRTPFSQRAGGVLCKTCRAGHKQVISVSAAVLATMARLSAPTANGMQTAIDPHHYGELRAVLNHYWAHLLGREPRMHRYLAATTRK
jgi:DNA repair protein RecO (recombination protein O)